MPAFSRPVSQLSCHKQVIQRFCHYSPHTFRTSSVLQRLSYSTTPRSKMSSTDYSKLETPTMCYVDFCLVPVGTGNVSVAKEVAEVQKVLKASGLPFTMHAAGTTVEGRWDEVMAAVGRAQAAVHRMGVVRIQTSMRVGSRTDKAQTAEQKVKRVQEILAKDEEGQK